VESAGDVLTILKTRKFALRRSSFPRFENSRNVEVFLTVAGVSPYTAGDGRVSLA
jgi:hypothetical protein